ncbi:lectin BRA-3-like [Mercenaria mercenaria]|uniref:lectin BRA-3-like n=1 Tax=Mercenaria mercenaria TaxID=6596 RepID=UPI00234F6174|nr:lectin BRA-3-like [Mercenaria mercenaria]XP_053377706.1 lectin BRA-3-like [Mercenaria mercenaria]
MKLTLYCAVICLAFAITCFTGPEIAADAKPIPGCASNTECPQGRRISRHVQGQLEPRSESSNSDDDSSDLNPEVDRCSPDPCENNGTCVEVADNYTCSCNDGFKGRNCEEAVTVKSCPEGGWVFFNGSCYYVSTTTVSWISALAACNETGGYLAEIQSQLEQEFLNNITSDGDYFWIALNDRQTEGQFVWETSGDLVSFEYWGLENFQPKPDTDCVFFANKASDNRYYWFEVDCDYDFVFYVCETDVI